MNENIDPKLYLFLDSCLHDKGIKDIPEDLKNSMITDLASRLEQWLMQAVFENIPESAAAEMAELTSKGALKEEVMEFLNAKIPNLPQIFEAEMLKFKQAYLGLNK
jgi:hypothetical protein